MSVSDRTYRALRIGKGPATSRLLWTVFGVADNRLALPPENRNDRWVLELYGRIARNEVTAYMLVANEMAAGVCWGAPWENGFWSCHWFCLPEFRGKHAIELGKEAVAAARRDIPGITRLLSWIDAANRPMVLWALRMGFRKIGELPDYFDGRPGIMVSLDMKKR